MFLDYNTTRAHITLSLTVRFLQQLNCMYYTNKSAMCFTHEWTDLMWFFLFFPPRMIHIHGAQSSQGKGELQESSESKAVNVIVVRAQSGSVP